MAIKHLGTKRPSTCEDCLFWHECEDEFDLSPNNKPCAEFIYWLNDNTPHDQQYLNTKPPWQTQKDWLIYLAKKAS